MGITITLSVLMVCTVVSPIAFNITGTLMFFFIPEFIGNMKDVVLTYVGFMFFDDISLTLMVAIGLMFSFIGVGYYALVSYLSEREKQQKLKMK